MKNTTQLMIAGILGLGLFSCNDDETNDIVIEDEIVSYLGTQSPGDVWSWEINKTQNTIAISWDAGTFDDLTDDIHVNADLEVLPSGFLKATNLDATPDNVEIPEDGTAWFYAFEVPGSVLMVKGEGSIKGDLITMVSEGDCADIAGTYNYFITAPGDGETFDPFIDESYGTAIMTAIDGGYDVTGQARSMDCLDGGPCTVNQSIGGLPVAECDGRGAITITDTETLATQSQGQFTAGGIMVLDNGEGNGGVVATKVDGGVSLSDLYNVTFNGLAYLPSNNDNPTVPVNLVIGGDGTGPGHQYSDVEAGTLDMAEGASFEFTGVSDGLVSGTVSFANGKEGKLVGGVIPIGSQYVMIISSFSPEEVGNDAFILVLASE